MASGSSKRRTSVGVLFWIAFILLVLVIFLANRSNIEQVLKTTGIVDVVKNHFSTDAGTSDTQTDATNDTNVAPSTDGTAAGDGAPPASDQRVVMEPDPAETPATTNTGTSSSNTTTRPAVEPTTAAPASTDAKPDTPPTATPVSAPAQRAPSPDPAKPNRLMAGLYFIRVTNDGRTFPQRVLHPVYYASSPLTETIKALIAGPTADELDDGLLNLIPSETRLLSAQVSHGVAYLNFNQAFRFNSLGAEGTVAQLLQIIYSSTEFPTVDKVQFLVEGEHVDYLGGDGIYVGEPLGRDAFSS